MSKPALPAGFFNIPAWSPLSSPRLLPSQDAFPPLFAVDSRLGRPKQPPSVTNHTRMTQQRSPLALSRPGAEPAAPVSAAIHRFATVLACLVVLLIAAGALVKSKEAGLSVPDWPLSYGGFNPPHWWRIETVRAEHGHRMFAGTIALLTVLLAILLQRGERRAWVRRLGWSAVGAVLAQAVLGGITVLFFLPPAISIAHAGLAELFLCLVTAIAV